MKQVIVIYGQPADRAAFDRHYAEVHVPLVNRMPRMHSFKYSKGPVQSSDAGNVPYLVATLSYATDADHAASLGSPEGKAAVADVANFATGGVTVLTIDLQGSATAS
jgi:uncharacterized protein (TIGR02118 family)